MKLRKLELLPLEDRSVPATLTTFTTSAAASPMDPLINVAAMNASKVTVDVHAPTSQGSHLGKLAANHNQTLVRDRQRGKSRRG